MGWRDMAKASRVRGAIQVGAEGRPRSSHMPGTVWRTCSSRWARSCSARASPINSLLSLPSPEPGEEPSHPPLPPPSFPLSPGSEKEPAPGPAAPLWLLSSPTPAAVRPPPRARCCSCCCAEETLQVDGPEDEAPRGGWSDRGPPPPPAGPPTPPPPSAGPPPRQATVRRGSGGVVGEVRVCGCSGVESVSGEDDHIQS